MDKINYDFIIRDLEIADFYKGYLGLLSELTETNNIDYEKWKERINIIKNNRYHKIFVIEDKGIIVASITLIIELKFIRNLSNLAHIEDVIVTQNYRNQGIANKLINYCINLSKKENCYKIILNCNKNLVKFYEKLGFTNKNQEMSIYY